jgi:CYTH domain-containing protein
LITSIYLPEEEFALLAATLPGARIQKLRHRLHAAPGVLMSVDEFQGDLAGLLLVEAECKTDDELAALPTPTFAIREVTDEPQYSGASLAMQGMPR